MNLKDKVVVITGGVSGMGAATAEYLFQQGAKIAVLDMQESQLSFPHAHWLCDVTNEVAVQKVLQEILLKFGEIRVCVNCAGIARASRIVGRQGAMPLAEFEKVIQINLIGTFNILRLVAEIMSHLDPLEKDAERGVIINTASIAAYEGQMGQAAYAASKGGIVSLTLPAARELAQFGIRVMTVAPGIMDTPMMASLSAEVRKTLNESVTYPKRLGEPIEFARIVKEIIENSYLNGSVIRLDGALRMTAK